MGARVTPTARSARLAAGRGAERSMNGLPTFSTSVSVSELRSAGISGSRRSLFQFIGEVDASGLGRAASDGAGDGAGDGRWAERPRDQVTRTIVLNLTIYCAIS